MTLAISISLVQPQTQGESAPEDLVNLDRSDITLDNADVTLDTTTYTP